MATKSIGSAVGGQPALNSLADQHTIVTLLHRVAPEDGGPSVPLPNPATPGTASPELIAAILAFQRRHAPLRYQDGRVDPHGFTLGKLNALARNQFPGSFDPPPEPPPPAPPEPDQNAKVEAWNRLALARNSPGSEMHRLWGAAGWLKDERNARGADGKPVNCGNKPLAYAEHYMLSRAFVASGAYFPMEGIPLGRQRYFLAAGALIVAYDVGKLANALWAKVDILTPGGSDVRRLLMGVIYHLGDCPMSDKPPDGTSIAWGFKGANDGLTPLN